ncbi:septum site-determining protein MinC [Cyanobium sp. Morenito 9A2]|uniref:septum site-determining protein MinC n=1 Tax=Cyanobium sp. Morenito 9A2 TaxID=2823718 RepID=UPI0020CB9220|nr:septum site-determining protein MinC [Cyanobium sp. Morenito 9A2]MCP9851143.1 septum site-determining protein MinC [Cyanobium sp. Morenito 9A2]
MAAVLIASGGPELPHVLRLSASEDAGGVLEQVRYALGLTPPVGPVLLQAGEWLLNTASVRNVAQHLAERGLELSAVQGYNGATLVAAAALGLPTERLLPGPSPEPPAHSGPSTALTVHRGTLRSGDHLQVAGAVLLLGDVNPGARISAGGSVLVWGRLRGVAHAGAAGDTGATITALQLRPLQLRIADAVARGPQDDPPAGFTETARLMDAAIEIEAADPLWPISD